MFTAPLRRTALVVALATASATLVGGTATAAPPTATSLAIRTVKPAVAPGGTTAVTGFLKVAAGVAPAGKPVTLEAKQKGEDEFTPIGIALTGAKGGVRLKVTPAATTRYRWDFAGDAANRPSTSGIATVRVRIAQHPPRRLTTSLSIRASKPRVGFDGTAMITGRLRSHRTPLVRKWVLLLAKADGATKWSFGAGKRTKRLGKVQFTVRPKVGTSYRLAFLGSRNFRPARSAVVHVAARPVRLRATVTPKLVDPGASAIVQGLLTNQGTPFGGQTVDLRSKPAGSGDPFATVGTAVSDDLGRVSFTVSPTAKTRYVLFHPRTADAPGARSHVVTLALKASTSLSIRGRTIAKGYAVSGRLRGAGDWLRNRWVVLQRLQGADWVGVGAKRTGRGGGVAFRKASAPGTSYRLHFAGNARFAPSTSGVVTQ